MHFEPYAYQRDWIDHMHGGASSLGFIEMGLGKTVCVLTYIRDVIEEDRPKRRRFLVVAPLRVARNVWRQEAAKWDHLRGLKVEFATGSPATRRKVLDDEAVDVVVINYENLRWLCGEYPDTFPFYGLVLDEGDKMKDPNTSRFKAFRYRAHEFAVRIAMSGTFAPESIENLWGPAFLTTSRIAGQTFPSRKPTMQAALGGSFFQFKRQHFAPTYPGSFKYEPLDGALDRIMESLGAYAFEARAEDHLDLPPLVVDDVVFDLPTEARKVYNKMEAELVVQLEKDEITAANAAVKVNKLRQICAGFMYAEEGAGRKTVPVHSAKTELFDDVVAQIAAPHLVVYGFKAEAKRFKYRLSSEVSERVETMTLQRWSANEISQLAFHPSSASHGLNLHEGGAHHIVYLTLPWSAGLYDQTNARLHRMGQQKTVIVHRLLAKNTVDEDVAQGLLHKESTREAVYAAIKARRG